MLKTLALITKHPLTRERPLGAVWRFLRWQLESRLREEVEFDWIVGARLAVRNGMTGATGNIYCGLHEFVDMALLLHMLRPGDLFVDVGANIGSYTVLASKVCGANTIAVEPDPGTAASLRKNVELNDIRALAEVHQCALGAENGQIGFTVGLDTMNRVDISASGGGQVVPLRTLDELLEGRQPILLKLDVEGFEEQVLAGARHTLAAPCLIAVETELESALVESVLIDAGFSRAWYNPFSRALSDRPLEVKASNSLYIRNPRELEGRLISAPRRDVLGVRL